MNAVTFNRGFAEGASRGRSLLGFLMCAALAAVGCGDDGGTTPTAGTGAAGMGAFAGAAGMATAGMMGGAGTGAAAGTMGGAGTGAAAPTATQVFMLFQTYCGVCHAMMPKPAINGDLGLVNNKAAFLGLINKPSASATCMGKGAYIVPGQPAQSLLFQKLMPNPPCGVQMPQNSSLTATEIAQFQAWIQAGAMDN